MDPIGKQLGRVIEQKLAQRDAASAARYEVIQRARKAFASVMRKFPPMDLNAVARNLGVSEIRYVHSHLDGKLLKESGGYVIEVNKEHQRGRQRFTIAHEFGHILVSKGGSLGCSTISTRSRMVHEPNGAEEALCDCAAAEILIPSEWVPAFLSSRSPSFETIAELAKTCDTSIEVAARRLIDAKLWRCRLVWWRHDGQRFTATRSYPAYDFATLVSMEVPNERNSMLWTVLKRGRPRRGTQSLRIEGEAREFDMEAWKNSGKSVVTLLVFEEFQSRSDRNLSLFIK
jgi:Zn-dependent peptidase ImmA (M78 family)